MKFIIKYRLFLLLALAISGGLSSCEEDESDGGAPMVTYIRSTDPTSSDSLIVAAGQGQLIAIVGMNLEKVNQMWFNDLPASLDPSYITSNTVLVRVPDDLPTEISNEITLGFSNSGDSLSIPFEVQIGEPSIDRLKSEYVNEGDVATIFGEFFYEPLTVTFSGGLVAELVEVEDGKIDVIVPAGAESGPITVTNTVGESESTGWFKDTRNIIASFDGTFEGMWRGDVNVVSSDPDISNINGNFLRTNAGAQAADPYIEVYGGPEDGDANIETQNIPADAYDNPADYVLKFEINTLETSAGVTMRLFLGPSNGDFGAARNTYYYSWNSNLDTEGEWETVSLPWQDVYDQNNNFPDNPGGDGIYIYFHGSVPAIHNFGMDNFRVVPIAND